LITLIIFGEAYNLWSSSLCSPLQPLPFRSKYSPQHPVLHSSLILRDQVLQFYVFYMWHKFILQWTKRSKIFLEKNVTKIFRIYFTQHF
jgi:hypothetical protein